jgi:predicted ATP-grasp superfamily ATP-dependent carboligase
MPFHVLITDAQERAMVATARNLSDSGHRVSAAADARPAAVHWSRACHKRLRVPSPVEHPAGFVQALEREVSGGGYDVLMPGGDASVLAVSEHRERLEPHVRLGLPSREIVKNCVDKLRLVEEAAAAGVPCPRTIPCAGTEEALAAGAELGFPVVLKPTQTVFLLDGAMHQLPSAFVRNAEILAVRAPNFGNPCLVQERISGPVYSCSGVIAESRLLAFATCRYSRTYPPKGGPVAFSQTVETPPELRSRVEALVRAFGWQGPFEVELVKRDDGSFSVIDFNPRVFGSMSVVIRAGAPMPAIWCDWLMKGDPEPTVARPRVYYRWEDADARHLMWQLRRGRMGAALAVLRPRRGVVHAYFRLRDPGPLFARLIYIVRNAFAKRRP